MQRSKKLKKYFLSYYISISWRSRFSTVRGQANRSFMLAIFFLQKNSRDKLTIQASHVCAKGRTGSKHSLNASTSFKHSTSCDNIYYFLYYLNYLCEVGDIIFMFMDNDTLWLMLDREENKLKLEGVGMLLRCGSERSVSGERNNVCKCMDIFTIDFFLSNWSSLKVNYISIELCFIFKTMFMFAFPQGHVKILFAMFFPHYFKN